ncbi:50S ribosomal protein L20 [archaeon]|nr:MAG: 50S ribosomal protein L20 [archaeon]
MVQVKKRDMRSLWIMRMNAASRMYGMQYSRLVSGMAKASIALNRKVLSELAVTEPLSFKSVVEVVKQIK